MGIALNCGLAAPPTTTTCHTPNTPEILNAIVNISFPTPFLPQQQQASTPFPPSSLSFPPAPQTAQSLPSPLLGHLRLPSQLTHRTKFRPAHPVTVHQGGTQDEGAPEAEVRTRRGRCLRN